MVSIKSCLVFFKQGHLYIENRNNISFRTSYSLRGRAPGRTKEREREREKGRRRNEGRREEGSLCVGTPPQAQAASLKGHRRGDDGWGSLICFIIRWNTSLVATRKATASRPHTTATILAACTTSQLPRPSLNHMP
jgi:hypothetical protein